MIKKIFPIFQWLPNYNSNYLKADLTAGFTLSAYAIPVSLAYSTLAGLPPQYGIYGFLIGGFMYAIFGTSKQMAVGPTSAISILIGTAVANLSDGDPFRWVDIASITALLFAVMSITAYFLRFSSIINFISETVLLGFKAATALTIAFTQLPKLFGVQSGGNTFIASIKNLFFQLPNTNFIILLFGISGFIVLVVGDKLFPGKPIAILVVIISTLLITYTPLGAMNFSTVGIIPSGLPQFYFPEFRLSDLQSDATLAFACFILAYVESVSAAKTLAEKTGEEIDPRQELLALGAANLGAAFGHGYPVSGGLSQSAVNEKAGAKTPMSLVFTTALIALCLLFFTGLFKNLPTVILASIIIFSIKGLVNLKEINRIFKKNKTDFIIAVTAFVSVLLFGILDGIMIGSVLSLALIIKVVSAPHVAFLGRIPGTNRFSDISRHADNEIISGLLILRVESPLLYFNTNFIYKEIMNKIQKNEDLLKTVILDLSTSAQVDTAGAKLIKQLYIELKAKGISFRISEAHAAVRDTLRKEDAEQLFGHIGRRDSLQEIVNIVVEQNLTTENK